MRENIDPLMNFDVQNREYGTISSSRSNEMAMRRTLRLKTRKQRELEHYRDHDTRPYVRERCGALLKIAAGETPHAVARQGVLKPREPDTLYGWLQVERSLQEVWKKK